MTTPRAAADRTAFFIVAWAGTLAVLLTSTWRLWTPMRGAPRIAPVEALESLPPTIDFGLLAFISYGLLRTLRVALSSRPSHDSRSGLDIDRTGILIATLAVMALMLLDQLRWQPWAYHAVLVGLILNTATSSQAFQLLRLVAIAVYAYSAIAKLDAEFAATLGQQMLGAVGLDLMSWPHTSRIAIALLIPSVEFAIAALLAASLWVNQLRKAACIATIAMHAATIGVLGPWALGHSLGVLLWNVGFASQTLILFWPQAEETDEHVTRSSPVALVACGVAVIAPALTPLGLWDQWTGWALYAPGGERATLFVHTGSVERLPKSLQPHIEESSVGPWRRVRLNEWVLAEVSAPIYPQNRIVAAIALGLMDRYPLTGRVRVVDESAASPLSRKRQLAEHYEISDIADAAPLFGLRPGITWTD